MLVLTQDQEDSTISALAAGSYRMIFSNYDSLYLDCGYISSAGDRNNWCTPYKGWQRIYSNDPYALLEMRGFDTSDPAVRDLVLGGEACMWTETVSSETVEDRVFPRASALGERLWSNPATDWYAAETRIVEERRRLVGRGVRAAKLTVEWCRQNADQCYVSDNAPQNP